MFGTAFDPPHFGTEGASEAFSLSCDWNFIPLPLEQSLAFIPSALEQELAFRTLQVQAGSPLFHTLQLCPLHIVSTADK